MTKVLLASASPRRRTLLTWLGYEIDVQPAHIDEVRRPGEAPEAYVQRLAVEKLAAVAPSGLAVAADTVVVLGEDVLEKPVDRQDAHAMLRRLSGVWHRVLTGVCVQTEERSAFVVETRLRFRDLSDEEIVRYLATGEADDKAGAYGIQGQAGVFVAEVVGSWTNVMGLPLEEVERCLKGR